MRDSANWIYQIGDRLEKSDIDALKLETHQCGYGMPENHKSEYDQNVCVGILDPVLSSHLGLIGSSYKRIDQLLQSLFNGELCKDQR